MGNPTETVENTSPDKAFKQFVTGPRLSKQQVKKIKKEYTPVRSKILFKTIPNGKKEKQ